MRLVLSFGIVAAYLSLQRPLADFVALAFFVVASACDFFDGYLARRLGLESALGRVLDPVADKVLILIALLAATAFSGMGEQLLLPASLIVLREVLITGLRENLGNACKALRTTMIAKWKTTAQMVALAIIFFASGMGQLESGLDFSGDSARMLHVVMGIPWKWLAVPLFWVAAILTLASGVDYLIKALPNLKGSQTND